ncbi:MFS transporter [Trinickia diaoshuihuensis]|uniref:MFS transporter n=1 Tax=Trinickia diaoshuihuensis TaxID=2292265 RepID=UPI001F079BCA|nr:MFS transporter [Trinickia diaoshuihuensis]
MPTPHLPITRLAGLTAVNFFRIGYQLVVAAWAAVQITGRADAAPMLLLIATVASMVLAPILGAMVDIVARKKTMLLSGHLGIALAGATPLFAEKMLAGRATFVGIAATVVLANVFSVVSGGAMDYFLKAHLPQPERTRQLATLNSTAQIALIVGTGFGGLVISRAVSSHAFLVVSLCGAVLAGCSYCLLPSLNVIRDEARSSWKRGVFSAGPALYLAHRRLFLIASCAALAFSIGQVTNTLLPGLVSVYLHGTSVNYSMVEGAWSVGALLTGVWLARFSTHASSSIHRDFMVIGAMAVVLAAIPFCPSFPALLLMHFLLGAGFALVRIRSETRFLSECPAQLLGRFRANSSLMTSSIGLTIFAAPTLCRGATAAGLYVAMAGAIAITVIGLLLATRQSVVVGSPAATGYCANKSGPNTS